MSYDDRQDDRDRNPPPLPRRRSVDEESFESDYERRSSRPPQPSGWGCSKGCLYGMAGCGCLSMIMVVAGVIIGWRFFAGAVSTDPVAIRAATQEIADLDIPAGFEPSFKFDLKIVQVVVFVSQDRESSLLLTQVDGKMVPVNANPDEIPLNRGEQKGQRKFDIIRQEPREMTIRGLKSKVMFIEAKDQESGREYRIVKGRFMGKAGPAEFEMQTPKEKFKEEDIKKFVEGIK